MSCSQLVKRLHYLKQRSNKIKKYLNRETLRGKYKEHNIAVKLSSVILRT